MSVDKERLRIRVKGLRNLPTLPDVYEKISDLVESPSTTAEEMGNIISSDQALSAKILRIVNSAFHGFPGRISSITHALIILGFDVARGLVLSTSVFDMMIGQGLHRMWEHSLGCALTAGVIARKIKHPNPEEVSVAALLHDIGKVIIKTELPEEASRVDLAIKERQISTYEAEEELLGLNHATVGRWLCEEWNLPNKLTDPIAYHHKPNMSELVRVPTAIVHVADVFVRAKNFGFAGDDLVPQIDPNAWEALDVSDSVLEEIIREMGDQLEDAEDFLGGDSVGPDAAKAEDAADPKPQG
jgi:putative nucleotidyltransferase with HDIG domain